MINSKIKVIYIAGPTRSGSTILSNILGQIDEFFNAGELIEFWDRGLEWPCSCGASVEECAIWSKVLEKIKTDGNKIAFNKIIGMRDKNAHSKKVLYLAYNKKAQKLFKNQIKEYVIGLTELYKAIKATTTCKVIIDASKNAGYAYILGTMPSIDLYIIHLIRDPRASVYSWMNKKHGLWTSSPLKTLPVWVIRNLGSEALARCWKNRYYRIHYENFIKNPRCITENILKFIDEKTEKLPFITEREVKLEESHGICGNPDRYKKGIILIKMDTAWKKMDKKNKFFASFMALPLIIRYKYPIIP
jgi:hypothetical protein